MANVSCILEQQDFDYHLAKVIRYKTANIYKKFPTIKPAYERWEEFAQDEDTGLVIYMISDLLETLELDFTLTMFKAETVFDADLLKGLTPVIGLDWFVKKLMGTKTFLPYVVESHLITEAVVREDVERQRQIAQNALNCSFDPKFSSTKTLERNVEPHSTPEDVVREDGEHQQRIAQNAIESSNNPQHSSMKRLERKIRMMFGSPQLDINASIISRRQSAPAHANLGFPNNTDRANMTYPYEANVPYFPLHRVEPLPENMRMPAPKSCAKSRPVCDCGPMTATPKTPKRPPRRSLSMAVHQRQRQEDQPNQAMDLLRPDSIPGPEDGPVDGSESGRRFTSRSRRRPLIEATTPPSILHIPEGNLVGSEYLPRPVYDDRPMPEYPLPYDDYLRIELDSARNRSRSMDYKPRRIEFEYPALEEANDDNDNLHKLAVNLEQRKVKGLERKRVCKKNTWR